MSLSLKDQIVIVSGAGRGLGAAVATAFTQEGAKVAIKGSFAGGTETCAKLYRRISRFSCAKFFLSLDCREKIERAYD